METLETREGESCAAVWVSRVSQPAAAQVGVVKQHVSVCATFTTSKTNLKICFARKDKICFAIKKKHGVSPSPRSRPEVPGWVLA